MHQTLRLCKEGGVGKGGGETKELKIAQGAAFFPEIIFFPYPAVSFNKEDYLFIYFSLSLLHFLLTFFYLVNATLPILAFKGDVR